ncbi:hypothetical protein T439DRAFT_359770 [Meredithblackwellia eburnea MCA 4105]
MSVTIYNDDSPMIQYSGDDWGLFTSSSWSGGTFHWCNGNTAPTPNCSAVISFTGTGIALVGSANTGNRRFYCSIDNQLPWLWANATIPGTASSNVVNTNQCTATGLTNGSHTLRYGQIAGDGHSAQGTLNGVTASPLDSFIVSTKASNVSTLTWSTQFDLVAPAAGYDYTVASSSSSSTESSSPPTTPAAVPNTSPGEGSSIGHSGSTATSIISGALSIPSEANGSAATPSSPAKTGAIVGGIVAGLAAFVIIAALAWRFKKRGSQFTGSSRTGSSWAGESRRADSVPPGGHRFMTEAPELVSENAPTFGRGAYWPAPVTSPSHILPSGKTGTSGSASVVGSEGLDDPSFFQERR